MSARPELNLAVVHEDETDLYVVDEPSLGLHVYSETLEELRTEVESRLWFIWSEYAEEDPDRLTAAARRLRTAYLERFTEDENAQGAP
ncbi:MAG: hypothetical protein ACRDD1_03180 [Planctomycetia bacterium]